MYRCVRAFIVAIIGLLSTSAWSVAPLQDVGVALQRHEAGTFYIRGAIAGYGDVDLLVDTGASFLVISESILTSLKAAGNARFSRELRGLMADGSPRVVPVYHLSALRLGDGCWIRDVEAAVFPGDSHPILGMNVLARLAPFTFSADPPHLALNQCQSRAVENLAGGDIPVDSPAPRLTP